MKYPILFFAQSEKPHSVKAIQSCPNCWGYSQWGGRDFPRKYETNKGTSSVDKSRDGFIRKFVKKYIG